MRRSEGQKTVLVTGASKGIGTAIAMWVTEANGGIVTGIAIEDYRDGYGAQVAFSRDPDE